MSAPGANSTSSATPAADSTSASAPNNATNRFRNGNHNRNNQRSTPRFVPKIADIETLATCSEHKGQDFAKFQKSLYHHVLTTFRNSKDMSKAILEFTDPHIALKKTQPSLSDIRTVQMIKKARPTSSYANRITTITKKWQRYSLITK